MDTKKAIQFGKLLILTLVVVYLVKTERLNLTNLSLLFARPANTLAVVALYCIAAYWLVSWRWQILLKLVGRPMSILQVFKITWISLFFGTFMLGSASADAVRAIFVIVDRPQNCSKTGILSAAFLDRSFGVYGLALMSTLGLWAFLWSGSFAAFGQQLAVFLILSVLGVSLAGWLLFSLPTEILKAGASRLLKDSLRSPASKLIDTLELYQGRWGVLFSCLLLTLGSQILLIASCLFIASMLSIDTSSVGSYFFAVPLAELSTALPIAPAGIGAGHLGYEWLFRAAGLSGGADLFNLFVVVRISWGLVGGAYYATFWKSTRKQDFSQASKFP